MNNIRTEVLGIDVEIQDLQTTLYTALVNDWSDNIEGYGRAYRNIKNDKQILENYIGNGEYKQVYHNDKNACTMFFIVGEDKKTEDGVVFTAEVKCVFMCSLNKVYPTDVERSDEKAQRKIAQTINESYQGDFEITKIETGVKNVFRGFDQEMIKFQDIHPYHCFSVNLDLTYYLNNCN